MAHDTRLDPSLTQHNYLQLRALARDLRAEAPLVPDGPVVDLGCGGKPYASLFGGRYIGVDLLATHGDPDCLGHAEQLPLRDGVAAVVISTQQLEHVDDPDRVLAEAHRILRPGGTLLLSTHGVWPYHPDPQDLWRWTEEGLRTLIARNGFTVERVHRQGGLVAVAASLLLYPLGGVRSRSRVLGALAAVALTAGNLVARAADQVVERLLPRHYASASYLVVATCRPTASPESPIGR